MLSRFSGLAGWSGLAKSIEELDYANTPLGELVLRRRSVASLGGADIYEVKLAGEFLMSSLVNDAEIALADVALGLVDDSDRDVLVGGLGLGYTAQAALAADRIRTVTVIELLPSVVQWHEQGIVPLGHVRADRFLRDVRRQCKAAR